MSSKRVMSNIFYNVSIFYIYYKNISRFILQGETEDCTEDDKDAMRPFSSRNACSFELEICLLEGISNDKLVGIRRKRLKGNAWVYKRVCEEVLALAAEDFSAESEGSTESKCPI